MHIRRQIVHKKTWNHDNAMVYLATQISLEICFLTKETLIVCPKSKHSPKQICLSQKCFIEAFNATHDHRLSVHRRSEKTLLSLKRYFFWHGNYKLVRILKKSCLTCKKSKKI